MIRCFLLLVWLASAAAQPPGSPAPTADRIARSVQDRDTGRDSRADLRMKLFDRRGRARDRALTLLTLRRAEGDRSLIRFTYPNDIRGTGFLVWEHPAGDDERFLYLPSLGRVRRIAGSEAQESFVGSDFSYEDIGGREFDDYTYALLDRERFVDRRGRTGSPGLSPRIPAQGCLRTVPARRFARAEGQLRGRPGGRLQPPQ